MMGTKTSACYKRGVTLTELSVSLVVITLMIAGTFSGITLLKAAKIRKAATEFTAYMQAIKEFEEQYDYLPGDLPTASSFWSGAHSGNGNGFVSTTPTEDLYAWEHLAKAKLVAGSFTGLYADNPTNSVRYAIWKNVPGSEAFTKGAFTFTDLGSSVYNTLGQPLRLSSLSGGNSGNAVMNAKDAYAIDIKIDDGLAATGLLYAVRIGSSCTDADLSAATANYNLSNTTVDCRLFYFYKKF